MLKHYSEHAYVSIRKSIPVFVVFFSILSSNAGAQNASKKDQLKNQQLLEKHITEQEVLRIEKVLSSDEMKGRKTFSKEIDSAAHFIAAHFKKAGLQPFSVQNFSSSANSSTTRASSSTRAYPSTARNESAFLQTFYLQKTQVKEASIRLNGEILANGNALFLLQKEKLSLSQETISSALYSAKVPEKNGFLFRKIGKEDDFRAQLSGILNQSEPMVVFVDSSHQAFFQRWKNRAPVRYSHQPSLVFLLTSGEVNQLNIEADVVLEKQKLSNVVGVLPGKAKKEEYVIFSAHYDHLGVGKPVEGDSIYNGANDDAAGTTAVMMLANYFAAAKNNERTLIFVAFTAEEIGAYGSTYFSQQMNPEKTMAMFNIEMIGTPSKWGENSAFITGFEKSNMGEILQKNLEGKGFSFYPDPYPNLQLFYRSDNATLARQGVPAHTISTSKMDQEPYYHTVNDEIETLDMANMTRIIRAIAISSASIVLGKDTPTRVDVSGLR